MTKKNEACENWFETLRDNPEDIIKWCREEIEQYEKLIELIKKQSKTPT
jgi:hypothetical protein